MKPFQQIKKDLREISQLAIDCGQHLPESTIQVIHERKIRKILKRYFSKQRELPKFRAT